MISDISRRTTLRIIGLPAWTALGGFANSVSLVAAPAAPLLKMEKVLVRALADSDWWGERELLLDSNIPRHILDAAVRPNADAKARSLLVQWERTSGYEFAKQKAEAAWDAVLEAEAEIAAATATDLCGLMVQAQILATRNRIMHWRDYGLVNSIVRGLERLSFSAERSALRDEAIFATCRDWRQAILAVECASDAFEKIELASWARRSPEYVSDPDRKAAIEDEQDGTGWRPALERLWAAREHLESIELVAVRQTAFSARALLLQAQLIAQRLAPDDSYAFVDARFGMTLVRGLEYLGCQPTRDLTEYVGPGERMF